MHAPLMPVVLAFFLLSQMHLGFLKQKKTVYQHSLESGVVILVSFQSLLALNIMLLYLYKQTTS